MEKNGFGLMSEAVWGGKKVLITGHTGFKGSWLAIWLELMGAEISGIALDPLYETGVFEMSGIGQRIKDYRADIRDLDKMLEIFSDVAPEVVFHLAAQPLVLDSYQNPVETFATNTQGTVHILEAIRKTPSVEAAVMVTTDKCYENREWVHGYRELDPMGGHDPYSASKGAAELVIAAYRNSFFSKSSHAAVASARAGNVIGGGDWAANRLVPDIIQAVESRATVDIRSPRSVRPWQFVLEPLSGYLSLASHLLETPDRFAAAWNFGPLPGNVLSVEHLVTTFLKHFGKGNWRDVSSASQPHEAKLLMLEISKAMHFLGWRPVLDFDETVRMTAEWYAAYQTTNVLELCQNQIKKYEELWNSKKEN